MQLSGQEFPKHDQSQKHSPGRKIWVPNHFFSKKKASEGPQLLISDAKVHFRQSFGLCKENSSTGDSLGYQYEWKKLPKEKRRTYAFETA